MYDAALTPCQKLYSRRVGTSTSFPVLEKKENKERRRRRDHGKKNKKKRNTENTRNLLTAALEGSLEPVLGAAAFSDLIAGDNAAASLATRSSSAFLLIALK